ncbi:MAG: hypothetical protein AB7F25_12370 [Deferribacterales bacterium]
MNNPELVKLRTLNAGERFIFRCYAKGVDEPVYEYTGTFGRVYEKNSDYCVVKADGDEKAGLEPSYWLVEKIENEQKGLDTVPHQS